MSDTLDVLIGARAEVEKGWCKGAGFKSGHVCAMGSVWVAMGGHGDSHNSEVDRYHRINAVLARHLPQPGLPSLLAVAGFNDHADTTLADVLAVFDRAIIAEAVKVTADTAHTFATVS